MKLFRMKYASVALFAMSCAAPSSGPGPAHGAEDVVAIVLGEKIERSSKHELHELILGPLLVNYADRKGIEPAEEEITAYLHWHEQVTKKMENWLEEMRLTVTRGLEDDTLTAEERADSEDHLSRIERIARSRSLKPELTEEGEQAFKEELRQMAMFFVKVWKIKSALYQEYGGRVAFQQAGPEPVDAFRDFLRKQQKLGAFRFTDEVCEAEFWEYLSGKRHFFYSKEKAENLMKIPPWMTDDWEK
jgi:hypothetical protein